MACEGKLVSIVAPFYNEGEVVESFYWAIRGILDGLPDTRFEVICVDDGSRDDTLQKLVSTNRSGRALLCHRVLPELRQRGRTYRRP